MNDIKRGASSSSFFFNNREEPHLKRGHSKFSSTHPLLSSSCVILYQSSITFLVFFFLSSLIREEFFLSIGDTDERCLCSSYCPIDLSTVVSGFYPSLEKIFHASILVWIDLGVLQAQMITDLSSQG